MWAMKLLSFIGLPKNDMVLSQFIKPLVYLVCGLLLVGVGFFSGCQHSAAKHAESVVEAQAEVSRLSALLQSESARLAFETRQKKQAERDRLNAIEVRDSKSDEVEALQRRIAQIVRQEAEAEGDESLDAGDLIVVRGSVIERVYSQAISGQLPNPGASTRVPALARITAADLSIGVRGGYSCTTEKCCWRIQPVPNKPRRSFVAVSTTTN